jgi:hypothetical protein
MTEVPPHFHKVDRISEEDLVPNGKVYEALPVTGVEGEKAVVFDGSDYAWYQYLDGAWQPINVGSTSANSVVAKMYLSGAQTIANGSNQRVAFDTVSFEETGIDADAANSKFIVAEDGYYHVHAQILYGAPVDTMTMSGKVVINNVTASPVAIAPNVAYTTAMQGVVVDDVLALSAGDTIELYIFHNYFTAPNLNLQTGEIYTFASVTKL